jgi:hypothetical protein
MPLLPDPIGFLEPRAELVVDVAGVGDAKGVQMIAGRKRLDLPEARTLATTGEHHMAIDPPAPRGKLRERHAHLKRDARFLRQHAHGPDGTNDRDDGVEERANLGRFAGEVNLERVTAARVRLIPVCELARARWTTPEGWSLFGRHRAMMRARMTRDAKHS